MQSLRHHLYQVWQFTLGYHFRGCSPLAKYFLRAHLLKQSSKIHRLASQELFSTPLPMPQNTNIHHHPRFHLWCRCSGLDPQALVFILQIVFPDKLCAHMHTQFSSKFPAALAHTLTFGQSEASSLPQVKP